MTKYALLDYDGFICKAFFAARARGNVDAAREVLCNLTKTALLKAEKEFAEPVIVKMFVSGHTWKKDIFEGYKASREKDPELKLFRDEVIADGLSIKSENLEADDLINLCREYIEWNNEDYVIFSDDKDLHAVAKRYCKINLSEYITYNEEPRDMLYAQMLAGDKEDDVAGLPKVGLKTAYKLLGNEACIEKVAAVYNDRGSSQLNAYKQILLIKPLSIEMNSHPISGVYAASRILQDEMVDEEILDDCIKGELRFVKEVLENEYHKELIG